MKDLVVASERGRGFEHVLERLREDRQEKIEIAKAEDELRKQGLTVVDKPARNDPVTPLYKIRYTNKTLTDQAHESCDGHAGFVEAYFKQQPKAPITRWTYLRRLDLPGEIGHVWRNDELMVISGFGDMEYQGIVVPHFHVSASVIGSDRRPTNDELDLVREAFDMEDAEEGNHSPGRIRNLFRPVHLPRGAIGICDCKENEEVVTEADGFQWQRER